MKCSQQQLHSTKVREQEVAVIIGCEFLNQTTRNLLLFVTVGSSLGQLFLTPVAIAALQATFHSSKMGELHC